MLKKTADLVEVATPYDNQSMHNAHDGARIRSRRAYEGLNASVGFRPAVYTGFKSECDEYIRIIEYIGHEYILGHLFVSIFLLQIYSDIRSCQICLNEYIRTFVGECVRV